MIALAAALGAALVGAFGTLAIAPVPRTALWLALVGWNWLKWELWFAWWLRRGWHWHAVLALGCVVLLLPLPFEVGLALEVIARVPAPPAAGIYAGGLGLGLVLVLALLAIGPRARSATTAATDAAPAPAPTRFPGTAVRLEAICAIVAEDHYVRLHLADGSQQLLHCRFSDALAALAGIPGEQVRRGAWLAEAHREAALRRDGHWQLTTGTGLSLAVSRSRVAQLRRRGWIGGATRRSDRGIA